MVSFILILVRLLLLPIFKLASFVLKQFKVFNLVLLLTSKLVIAVPVQFNVSKFVKCSIPFKLLIAL